MVASTATRASRRRRSQRSSRSTVSTRLAQVTSCSTPPEVIDHANSGGFDSNVEAGPELSGHETCRLWRCKRCKSQLTQSASNVPVGLCRGRSRPRLTPYAADALSSSISARNSALPRVELVPAAAYGEWETPTQNGPAGTGSGTEPYLGNFGRAGSLRQSLVRAGEVAGSQGQALRALRGFQTSPGLSGGSTGAAWCLGRRGNMALYRRAGIYCIKLANLTIELAVWDFEFRRDHLRQTHSSPRACSAHWSCCSSRLNACNAAQRRASG